MRFRPFVALVLSLCLAPSLPVAEADATTAPGALRRRLLALEEKGELDAHARAALDQARRALDQAQASESQGQTDAAARASSLADAALTLAERLEALVRERALLRSVRARRENLPAREKAARAALAQEEARLRELGGEVPP